MKSLMKLQLATIFRSPTPYLLVFIVLPLLYILSASFLPALLVIPGVMMIIIVTMTFFVFGTALFQAKNSIIFKRLEIVGLTRSKFVLGNAILSMLISVSSVYIIFEMFASASGMANITSWFDSPQELSDKSHDYETNLLVPMSFDWFFLNDLFNTLDDAIWIILIDLMYRASELQLVDPQKLSWIILRLSEVVDRNSVWLIIRGPLEELLGRPLEKTDVVNWLEDLSIDIGNEEGPLDGYFLGIANNMQIQYIENGSHAPKGIITTGILNSIQEIDGPHYEWPVVWDSDSNNAIFRPRRYYAFHFQNGEDKYYTQMFYSRMMPTISTLFSDNIGPSTIVHHGSNGIQTTMLSSWVKYFMMILIASLLIYSIMLLFVSISNNFEQYSILSGLSLILIFIFSGMVLPFTIILSFPLMFAFASLLPTTPIIFEIQHLWSMEPVVKIAAQPYQNIQWSVLYPILISILLLVISVRMLSTENGELTKKFKHEQRSKNSSLVNIFANALILFLVLLWYYSIIKYRVENSNQIGTTEYPSNWKMFIPLLMFILYTLLLFANVVFFAGRSMTFYRNSKLIYLVNAIALFPIGIFTSITGITSNVNTNF